MGCSPERFGCKAFGPSMATSFPWATRQMCEAVLPVAILPLHLRCDAAGPVEAIFFPSFGQQHTPYRHHTETEELELLELVISKPLRFYNLYCLHQFLGGAASGEQPLIITDHWTKEESL